MRWIVTLVFTALLLVMFFIFQPASGVDPADTPPLNAQIIAFDYDGLHKDVSPESLYNGDGVIFLTIQGKKIYFFTSLNDFKAYDPGQKGYIALENPGFATFYVGRYLSGTGTVEYQPLQHSGIAGIVLTYADNVLKSASVVLTDSSQRNLDPVILNDNFLLSATLTSSQDGKAGNEQQGLEF